MDDDAKRIVSDLESGKLPDIKKGAGDKGKDLTGVRYNKMYRSDKAGSILESTACYSISEPNEKAVRETHPKGGVAIKPSRKIKSRGKK